MLKTLIKRLKDRLGIVTITDRIEALERKMERCDHDWSEVTITVDGNAGRYWSTPSSTIEVCSRCGDSRTLAQTASTSNTASIRLRNSEGQ